MRDTINFFLGFKEPLNDSEEYTRKFNMTKIYDSDDFNVDEAFAFLESLQGMPSAIVPDDLSKIEHSDL